jgi:hypothetical protein
VEVKPGPLELLLSIVSIDEKANFQTSFVTPRLLIAVTGDEGNGAAEGQEGGRLTSSPLFSNCKCCTMHMDCSFKKYYFLGTGSVVQYQKKSNLLKN